MEDGPAYTIELAKSGRAACKKCKEKIGKGEERIGAHTYHDHHMTRWYHVGCFPIPRKFKTISINEFIEEHLVDETEDKILQDPTKLQEIVDLLKSKASSAKGGAGTVGADSEKGSEFIKRIKRDADELEKNGEDDGPSKKKLKLSKDSMAKAEAYLKFSGMKTDELKDILSWNNVVKTGTKEVLLTRVIDGYVYGRIGKCVACGGGQPKISDNGSCIECNGYFDKDSNFRISCGNKIKVESAERFKPWYTEKPTEEQEEAMKQESASADNSSDEKLPSKMVKAVNKMEWDLSNKQSLKNAATEMLKICTSEVSPIDIPMKDEVKSRMEIGKMILQNRDKTASEVLDLIVEKYGLKTKNDAKEKKVTKQIESMCAVAANGSVYKVLKELSDLYYKEKNTNAGNSYRKVANAVKDLDFEINEDNAKGLGKGKTKIPGVGKSSADKIHEFLTTGKIQKLEEKRAGQA